MTVNAKNDKLTVNVSALEEVMSIITSHPHLHEQDIYVRGDFSNQLSKGIENMPPGWKWANGSHTIKMMADCGTAARFAGWTGNLFAEEFGWKVNERNNGLYFTKGDTFVHVAALAQEILGLTEDQTEVLFAGVNTIPMLQMMVKDLSNTGDLRPWTEYREGPSDLLDAS